MEESIPLNPQKVHHSLLLVEQRLIFDTMSGSRAGLNIVHLLRLCMISAHPFTEGEWQKQSCNRKFSFYAS